MVNQPFVTRQESREPSASDPGAAEHSLRAQRGNGTLSLKAALDNEIDGLLRLAACVPFTLPR
ncbi:hypothetical protein PXNS11_210110 [Stutzerimonas xanthomarina]|nr:hypothetical protein PXNS11_210110 [Stutzerimonas xanthomarina]